IWTITSGFPALSAHVLVDPGADCHAVREELEHMLAERFSLTHTTLQVEHAGGPVRRVAIGAPYRRRGPPGRWRRPRRLCRRFAARPPWSPARPAAWAPRRSTCSHARG